MMPSRVVADSAGVDGRPVFLTSCFAVFKILADVANDAIPASGRASPTNRLVSSSRNLARPSVHSGPAGMTDQ
jgi:hypothetical protein